MDTCNSSVLIDLATAMHLVEQIPMISPTNNEVRQLIELGEGGAEEIARLVEHDRIVSQVMLHAANVAFYSPSGSIDSVNRAIALLGINAVTKLVDQSTLTAALRPLTTPAMSSFWQYAYSAAQAARLLAVATRVATPEEAFTASLMQRVGQALMMVKFSDDYQQVHERMRDPEAQLLEVERSIFGATQVELGYMLTRRWRLDEMIVRLVLHQFEPEKADTLTPFAVLLHLAQSIVSGLGLGSEGAYWMRVDPVQPATWKKLGWDQMAFEPICQQVLEAQNEFEGFYDAVRNS